MKKYLNGFSIFMGLLTLTSCLSNQMITGSEEYADFSRKKEIKVLLIQTDRDSIVYFSKAYPGFLCDTSVSGYEQVPLAAFGADSVIRKNITGKALQALKHRAAYPVITDNDRELVLVSSRVISLPYSDIKTMQVRCLNPTHTAIAAFLSGGFFVGMAFMISNLSFVML